MLTAYAKMLKPLFTNKRIMKKRHLFIYIGLVLGLSTSLALAADNDFICSNKKLATPVDPVAEKTTISFTNWADYMSPDLVPCFNRLSNAQVKYSYTSDDNMTRAKVLTGASGYDVIEQGALYMPNEIKANALIKLDKSKLPNYALRNKAIYEKVAQASDPNNDYGIIYSYGTTGLAYNQQLIESALGKGVIPDSWEYVFNPEKLKLISRCGVSLLDEPEQIFGNYFHYAGIDPNTQSKADYEKAALYIIKNVRPYIKYFDSNKYQNDFTAGNLCLVMGYSGDMVRSVERAKEINPEVSLHYVLPKEGTNIWFDMLLVPKGAKNLDTVYQFLNYMMDPYIAAMNSNYLYQPNAMDHNQKYLSHLFDDPNVRPTDEMIENMYVLAIQPPELQAFISRMWMNVKYGISFKPKYYKGN